MKPQAILVANFRSAAAPITVDISVKDIPTGYSLFIYPNLQDLKEVGKVNNATGTINIVLAQQFGIYILNKQANVSHLATAHFEPGALCIHREPEWQDGTVTHEELSVVWRSPQIVSSKK